MLKIWNSHPILKPAIHYCDFLIFLGNIGFFLLLLCCLTCSYGVLASIGAAYFRHLQKVEIKVEQRQIDRQQHERNPQVNQPDGAGHVGIVNGIDGGETKRRQSHVNETDWPQNLLYSGNPENNSG